MRLPRRVPWSSLSELDDICSCIYADQDDIAAKKQAINRATWKAITPLPHALDSILSLLVILVQDSEQIPGYNLALRQSYAIAIIRLVNGLVDPLQLGAYARSIASIAQQLNLPPWLVELRHAATHEELPSLDVLREAARQSMAWLLDNYFMPLLNPLPVAPQEAPKMRPLLPVLKTYKQTMRLITRDASLKNQYKPKILSLLKDSERWISECRVTANISMGELGWTAAQRSDSLTSDSDGKETWALEQFCDVLAERGALIPLAKKKRVTSKEGLLPSQASIILWEPLLQHIHNIHLDFPFTLCHRFSRILIQHLCLKTESNTHTSDPSYDEYLASWIIWVTQTWEQIPDLRKEVLVYLIQQLGTEMPSSSAGRALVFRLLDTLAVDVDDLQPAINFLRTAHSSAGSSTKWHSEDLNVMLQRMDSIQVAPELSPESMSQETNNCEGTVVLPTGWSKTSRTWAPCPIGVHA
ncbi:hypothetical protein CVT24_004285 [Panaeolus cyanescens]|uniref:Las1-domain-containing protein n=1 Tax=Panaeolus cyanescens TaxID=181874 RepID=A0A409VDB8_9AGAR|nr:hypothetical protein CVT24_004285 [Panaeolus cyanescens]